ncbi:hypothetical protein LTR56_006038 [Elasticomyces elasticus]|nr:hypothetical protein LTR56_006038 [Elasticomyces elasticus]KAK3669000.1 hypothetical protein LTR22_000079 [Elasticomyces elasticus]KAK4922700.1 hypothetical protein LTR49_010056 [Elasticomyces elasticus]KAK5760955.1 hypothetical protein LTS12_008959 [Elasticomyces elasticus]
MALQNIILVGAGGSLGVALIKGLTSEPSFNVTCLVRESSSTLKTIPKDYPSVTIRKISDSCPKDELIEAFKGQDAVVNATTAVEEQYRFIDAAIEAGVRHYVPSEFGLDNSRAEARAMCALFDGKGKVAKYLESKKFTGLTWHAIACGMWIDWAFKNSFLGLDYANRTISFYDDGRGKFSTSTLANTALALNRSLLAPEKAKNRRIFISDFALSQEELVQIIERVSGDKWTVKTVDSKARYTEASKKVAEGDPYAVYTQIEIGFATGKYGGHFEEKEELFNDVLGLPKQDKEEVVRAALKSMES